MVAKKQFIPLLFILIIVAAGCSISGDPASGVPNSAVITPSVFAKVDSPTTAVAPPSTDPAPRDSTIPTQQAENTTQLPLPTSTITPTPTGTEVIFEVGEEITIDYLRDLEITGSEITFEEQLPNGANYYQHLVSYISEGNKIFGLLTIPFPEPPEGGYKAIVFNHGYIPPAAYRTTERYTAYVDHLASNGFVVLKIDYRGHGQSQGEPSGTYFSSAYTIDAIAALKSLQTMDIIDPQGIGMWGHSMAGNLVLRAMLIEPDIKAGVI
jgi:hypothetical protein